MKLFQFIFINVKTGFDKLRFNISCKKIGWEEKFDTLPID